MKTGQLVRQFRLRNIVEWFLRAIGVLLILASIGKLVTVLSEAPIVAAKDPLIGVGYRYLLIPIGLVELIFGLKLLKSRDPIFDSVLAGGLGLVFVAYHIFVRQIKELWTCPCFGTIPQWLPLPEGAVTVFIIGSAVLMLLGGVAGTVLLQIEGDINGEKSGKAPSI